jgi:hypothetical protein
MIIYNPKDSVVEFRYGGVMHYYMPRETKVVDEAMGEFILNRARVGLTIYDGNVEAVAEETYASMPWRQLVSLASARGLYKTGFGMKKEEVVKIMEAYDQQKGRTLQESANQEEGAGA